ncbi:MAG: ABC transporter permease [Thermodesulfobacteriota bacterium]
MNFRETDGKTEPTKANRGEVRRFPGLPLKLAGMALLVLIWALMGQIIFRMPEYEQFDGFMPLPTLKALSKMVLSSVYWNSVGASLTRVTAGIGYAFLIGLPGGLLIGFYSRLRLLTAVPVQFLRMISPLAWMPIALLVFLRFDSAIIFLVTMATVWPILLNTVSGVANVNPQWIHMARNQGADNFQLITRILLPASVPHIFTSLRLSIGVAWIVLVPAEYMGVTSGLGYIINDARDTLEYDRLMATVISIGLLGFLLDSAVQSLERVFYHRQGKNPFE